MPNQIDISDAISSIHREHPRRTGFWPQYCGLGTRLRGRFYVSDMIREGDRWEYYDGREADVIDVTAEQRPENYHDTHNHYQTALYEVINLAPHTNAVPVWGDGAALVHEASAWGAFFSARSVLVDAGTGQNIHFGPAATAAAEALKTDDFDCQLTGLEVDVLNQGKPGVFPNKAKHGITICGFGNPNSHGISLICENFDCAPEQRKGQFEAGIYVQSSIHPDYGRLLVADFEHAHIGLDFRKPVFRWGAMQINTDGPGTGIVFNEGKGGEVFAGTRWPGAGGERWLSLRIGDEGLRIVNADNTAEILAIDRHGGVYCNGDLFVNGERLDDLVARKVAEALVAERRAAAQ